MRERGRGVTSNVIGTVVAVGTMIVARDRLKVSYVWLVCGRVDGSAEVIGVGIEVGSALGELRELLCRHRGC